MLLLTAVAISAIASRHKIAIPIGIGSAMLGAGIAASVVHRNNQN